MPTSMPRRADPDEAFENDSLLTEEHHARLLKQRGPKKANAQVVRAYHPVSVALEVHACPERACPPTTPVATSVSKYSTFRSNDLSSFWVLGFTTASSKSPFTKWPADVM